MTDRDAIAQFKFRLRRLSGLFWPRSSIAAICFKAFSTNDTSQQTQIFTGLLADGKQETTCDSGNNNC